MDKEIDDLRERVLALETEVSELVEIVKKHIRLKGHHADEMNELYWKNDTGAI